MDYDYFEIKIPCQNNEVDEIEEFLFSLGSCSVTFEDAEDVAILEPAPGEMPLWQDIEMTGMFTTDYDENQICEAVEKQYSRNAKIKRLQNQQWERTWLEHFKPMKFGASTWIIPSEFKAEDEKAVNIFLDPGLAFGTGTHATTALCLDWIDNNNLENLNVIDFGCGSGILAIAALKHGAKRALCTDIDPQAITATLDNAKKNHVKDGIEIIQPDNFEDVKNQDVILANILAKPLMTLVDTFYTMLASGGHLIMSGILAEQADEIVEKFSPSFVDFQVNFKDDWASVYARRK